MSQNSSSDETDSSEEQRPSFTDILHRFEKLNQSNLLQSKSVSFRRGFSHESDLLKNGAANEYVGNLHINIPKKQPVPEKKVSFELLPPNASLGKSIKIKRTNLRRSKTMGNPVGNMEEKIVHKGQNDVVSPSPTNIHKEHNDLLQNLENFHRPNNNKPVPSIRIKVDQSIKKTTSAVNLYTEETNESEELLAANNVILKLPKRLSDISKEPLDNEGVINDLVANGKIVYDIKASNLPPLPPRRINIYTRESLDDPGKEIKQAVSKQGDDFEDLLKATYCPLSTIRTGDVSRKSLEGHGVTNDLVVTRRISYDEQANNASPIPSRRTSCYTRESLDDQKERDDLKVLKKTVEFEELLEASERPSRRTDDVSKKSLEDQIEFWQERNVLQKLPNRFGKESLHDEGVINDLLVTEKSVYDVEASNAPPIPPRVTFYTGESLDEPRKTNEQAVSKQHDDFKDLLKGTCDPLKPLIRASDVSRKSMESQGVRNDLVVTFNVEASNLPPIPSPRTSYYTRKSLDNQEERDDLAVLERPNDIEKLLKASGVTLRPPRKTNDVFRESLKDLKIGDDLKISDFPLIPPRRSSNYTREFFDGQSVKNDLVVLRNNSFHIGATSINVSQPRPRSVYVEKAEDKKNKGAIKKAEEVNKNIDKKLPQKYSLKNYSTSTISLPIYENRTQEDPNIPPLPPKSLTLKQTAVADLSSPLSSSSSTKLNFKKNSLDLDAVKRLIELKSIFMSNSISNSDKYKKSIELLFDIIFESVQEDVADVDDRSEDAADCSAWYINMKDFVHNETKEYLKENQLEVNNASIPYDKLLNKMVPKFIENYVVRDAEPSQESKGNEEDDYEKYETKRNEEGNEEKLRAEDTSEKTAEIINKLIQTETIYLSDLESYIDEYTKEKSITYITSILNDLWIMQCKFKDTLEEKKIELLWILRTFLDLEDLFGLYVEFFCNIVAASNENLESSDDLSTLLLNRLTNYKLFIKQIVKKLKQKEEINKERETADNVIKLLNVTIEKCNNAFSTASISSRHSHHEIENLVYVDEDETTNILARLLPASHDWNEYGLLLLKNNFKIDNRKTNYAVFLFQKMIVITQEITKDDYKYEYCLKLNEVLLLPQGKNKKAIKLKDYLKSKSSSKEVITKLEAKSEEIQLKWREKINECLWDQLEQQKQKSKTQYQNTVF